ncbi:MAG: carbamoyltransferase HypF [Bacillota bacterium]|nr:carbamoyltransferase HypF [Bacillota bacterium]
MAEGDSGLVRAEILLQGVVQGVGFRPFIFRLAERFGLAGRVYNSPSGVVIEVEGRRPAVEEFHRAIPREAPPLSRISREELRWLPPAGYQSFEIVSSAEEGAAGVLIPPDVALCEACLREFNNPRDRRYHYPFINCTDCGPRFTIIEALPYDRHRTTMKHFPMCPECAAEYRDPRYRRFHAQPNACPVCGPKVWLAPVEAAGDPPPPEAGETERLLAEARARLKRGEILAVKGLGGFHLICDALQEEPVATLRRRKHRPAKPFAVMCRDLEVVRAYCRLSPEEEALLTGWRKPIVLLLRKGEEELPPGLPPVAPSVAPGVATLGVMLPYTPLHHLLFDEELSCLVATSGNLAELPLAIDNAEAGRDLGGLADHFLLHDRPIHNRCDDSVTAVILGRETVYRRARGYAPAPVVHREKLRPCLALGGDQKNTFCVTRDNLLFLSQHIGEVEGPAAIDFLHTALRRFVRYFQLRPEVVACDLHPQYRTTLLAERYAEELGQKPVPVQHHEAHLASCLVEHQVFDPVLGVVCDGTGYGSDGHLWGFEFFAGSLGGKEPFRRLGHLEYVPLPGGEAAIRHPARVLYSHLFHALGEEGVERARRLRPHWHTSEMPVVRQQIQRRLNAPLTSSCGRLFDAVSALLGVCLEGTYEGQPAVELESLLPPGYLWRGEECYPFALREEEGQFFFSLAPFWEELLNDLEAEVPAVEVAARFHRTVAAMILEGVLRGRKATGLAKVALSGGVFQNRSLVEYLVPRLEREGFATFTQHSVPTNDGGIALGQAVLATRFGET